MKKPGLALWGAIACFLAFFAAALPAVLAIAAGGWRRVGAPVGVIGGADGPTAIFVGAKPGPAAVALAVLAPVAALLAGVLLLKKYIKARRAGL